LGLLGPNGAGKSTTFNMTTMDLKRSTGEIKLFNVPLDNLNIEEFGPKMGMVPQHNTIWEVLTVDESMDFVSRIKGLNKVEMTFQKDFIKKTLDLTAFSNTRAGNLSGGNKRKLVCAMSLIGCPSIEFLDEPTTGVDPVSRRSLFNMLKSLDKSALVLTTHRMDEAEALCDNIAIMINGRFCAYGSTGQLKDTYGKGYAINMTHTCDVKYVEQFMNNEMPYV